MSYQVFWITGPGELAVKDLTFDDSNGIPTTVSPDQSEELTEEEAVERREKLKKKNPSQRFTVRKLTARS